MAKKITLKNCPLKDDYKSWDAYKRSDRLFTSCPACGAYGSHVQFGDK